MPDITTLLQGGGGMGALGGLLGGAQMADSQPGLLGNGWNDPKSQANMALFGAMIGGNLPAGLKAYGDIMGPEAQMQRGLLGAKLNEAQLNQAMQAYQLKRLQAWDQMVNGDGGQAAQQAAAPAQSSLPPGSITSPGAFFPSTDGMGPVAPPSEMPQASPQAAAQGDPARWQYGLRGMSDQTSRAIAASMNPADYMKLLATQNAPQTDIEKLLASQGIQASSPVGQMFIAQAIKKANNIPLQSGRAGAPMYDGDGNIVAMAPKIPDNAIPQVVNGRVVGVTPLPGGAAMSQINAFAGQAGKNQAEPMTAYTGNQPVFTNKLAAAQGGIQPDGDPNVQGTPYQRAGSDVAALQRQIADVNRSMAPASVKQGQLDILNAELSKAQNAQQGAALQSAAPLTPAPSLGAEKGATLSQEELSKKGASLMADNSNVATVVSRLQNIKMLAPQAIAGAEKERRDFFNGLLSFAGVPAATDAKTASDLVDKNAAQIVTALRMGQGGAGTDALQAQLNQANPSRHMTVPAINEAVDQLVAQQKMLQAKANLLQPHYVGRDPISYSSKELQFDQNSDPRVWQLQAMNPQEQASYVKTLPAAVAADMLKKRQALRALGVLQ